jgi:hypothetical protein
VVKPARLAGCSSGAGIRRLLVGALLCSPITGDAKEASPRPARIPDSAVSLVGSIDEAMVERFDKAVRERNVKTVYIASAGGGERESLQIAEVIQARKMDVVVREVCASTCAHLIFVAGRQRRIEGEAVVMFRSSAAGLSDLFDAVGENVPKDFRPTPDWLEFAAREERLYAKAGVSTSLLLDAQVAQQPRCLVFNRREGKPLGTSLSITYALWVPTRKQMEAAGISFTGFWPKSRRELLRVGAQYMQSKEQPGQVQYLRFGDDDHLWRRGQPKYALKELQACALEEEGR